MCTVWALRMQIGLFGIDCYICPDSMETEPWKPWIFGTEWGKSCEMEQKKKSNGLLEEENTFLRTKRLASASAAWNVFHFPPFITRAVKLPVSGVKSLDFCKNRIFVVEIQWQWHYEIMLWDWIWSEKKSADTFCKITVLMCALNSWFWFIILHSLFHMTTGTLEESPHSSRKKQKTKWYTDQRYTYRLVQTLEAGQREHIWGCFLILMLTGSPAQVSGLH